MLCSTIVQNQNQFWIHEAEGFEPRQRLKPLKRDARRFIILSTFNIGKSYFSSNVFSCVVSFGRDFLKLKYQNRPAFWIVSKNIQHYVSLFFPADYLCSQQSHQYSNVWNYIPRFLPMGLSSTAGRSSQMTAKRRKLILTLNHSGLSTHHSTYVITNSTQR